MSYGKQLAEFTDAEKLEAFRDYWAHFQTVETFADLNHLSESVADAVIREGRELWNARAARLKGEG